MVQNQNRLAKIFHNFFFEILIKIKSSFSTHFFFGNFSHFHLGFTNGIKRGYNVIPSFIIILLCDYYEVKYVNKWNENWKNVDHGGFFQQFPLVFFCYCFILFSSNDVCFRKQLYVHSLFKHTQSFVNFESNLLSFLKRFCWLFFYTISLLILKLIFMDCFRLKIK